MTEAPTAPTAPPFDWELPRTKFLAAVSGLEFAQVMLCNHYNGGYGTPGFDDSLLRSLPADWHPRLMAAWDKWWALLEERLASAQLRQTIAALEVVEASGRTWDAQAIADEAGLSREELHAVLGRIESLVT